MVHRQARPSSRGSLGGGDPKQQAPSRKFSLQSEEALRQLTELDGRLTDIEQKVEQISEVARGSSQPTAEAVSRMRTTLAQLEVDANKLESKGVDSIYTSELGSGQVAAKEYKKSQLQRLQKLFVVIEDLFKLLSRDCSTQSSGNE